MNIWTLCNTYPGLLEKLISFSIFPARYPTSWRSSFCACSYPPICLSLFHFPSWERQLPCFCPKIILFNQENHRIVFSWTERKDKNAFGALNNISGQFFPPWHLELVLIHREHWTLIYLLLRDSKRAFWGNGKRFLRLLGKVSVDSD